MKKLPKRMPVYGHNAGLSAAQTATDFTAADIERVEQMFSRVFPKDPKGYAQKVIEYAGLRRGLRQSLERISAQLSNGEKS